MGRALVSCLLFGLAAAASGCAAGYTSALGYRARQAAIAQDVEAFVSLMDEAAGTLPAFPRDNPKKTVLSHFLDLGGDPRFLPMIDGWRARGLVDDAMTCAIHRARYRGAVRREPEQAEQAADVCLERAREAALAGDRRWEVEACLEEAPFLTHGATTTLARYLVLAVDPTEPFLFRAGLLGGMTTLYLQDPYTRLSNTPDLSPLQARGEAQAQYRAAAARMKAILAQVRPTAEAGLVAGATAFAALELERAGLAVGESFLAGFAESGAPEDNDLAWDWVRALKAKPKIGRLVPLGLWDRKREPADDAYWFVCAAPGAGRSEASIQREGASVARAALSAGRCRERPLVFGPYPLERTARVAATSSAARSGLELLFTRP